MATERPDGPASGELTHVDERGAARMVSVQGKAETAREALACGRVEMKPATLRRLLSGDLPKGEVLPVARLAAIQAVKRTADLIPLCHPLRITGVQVEFTPLFGMTEERDGLEVRVRVHAMDRTGVEMEALTGVTVAALTLYDMCKAVDRGMRIVDVKLLEKWGGKSGWVRDGGAAE